GGPGRCAGRPDRPPLRAARAAGGRGAARRRAAAPQGALVRTAIDPALPRGLPSDGRGAVVTVGTFDGVHRGHREVLREIVGRARRTGRRSVLVTFHPHPLRIVRPEMAPPLLTTPK